MGYLLTLLLLAAPALAQDAFPPGAPPMPVCNAVREGVVACLSGKQCLCNFQPGGQLTGRPDGWRWDCGALRPNCPPPPAQQPAPPHFPVTPEVVVPFPPRPWR